MRCVRSLTVAWIGVTSVFAGPALGEPLPDDGEANATNHRDATFLYFTGADLWRKGGTSYGGALWSPGGLNADGFTLKMLLAGGDYLYRSWTTDIRGIGLAASVLPGYRIKRGDLEVKIYAGLDVQHHWTLPDDPGNRLRGTHLGARVNLDAWWEPLPARMMVATTLTASTIGGSYGARAATGWRLLDRFWAGPEIETSGDRNYQQYRVGAHLTSLQFAGYEWAFGGGYVQDNSRRSGLYGRFSVLTRR